MTVQQAIDELKLLPTDGILMVPSLGDGGSVPLRAFKDCDDDSQKSLHWIDVVYASDEDWKNWET